MFVSFSTIPLACYSMENDLNLLANKIFNKIFCTLIIEYLNGTTIKTFDIERILKIANPFLMMEREEYSSLIIRLFNSLITRKEFPHYLIPHKPLPNYLGNNPDYRITEKHPLCYYKILFNMSIYIDLNKHLDNIKSEKYKKILSIIKKYYPDNIKVFFDEQKKLIIDEEKKAQRAHQRFRYVLNNCHISNEQKKKLFLYIKNEGIQYTPTKYTTKTKHSINSFLNKSNNEIKSEHEDLLLIPFEGGCFEPRTFWKELRCKPLMKSKKFNQNPKK